MRWLLRTGVALVAAVLAAITAAGWLVVQPTFTPLRPPDPAPEVNAADLEADVRALLTSFGPRDHTQVAHLDAAATWLAGRLAGSGARVSDQAFEAGGATYRNVVGEYGTASGDLVVVGAHYDAWGGHPGADDNASGVAVLLALARAFGAAAPPGRVQLVAWSVEEPPHFRTLAMGSAVHAQGLAAKGEKVRCAISLETLGYFTDRPDSQRFPVGVLSWIYPTTGNFVGVVGLIGQGGVTRTIKRAMRGASDQPVVSINAPRGLRGVDFSDHRSYWEHGWPAVMITDTAFYRNERYHRADDTPETLDYPRMAKVARGVWSAATVLAAQR